MSGKRVYLLIVASLAILVVIAACAEEEIPTQAPIEFHPTAAVEVERPDAVVEEPTAVVEAPSGGDAAAGQELFISCGGCHSADDTQIVGPGLKGIYDRAGTRTSLSADGYIEQSLRDPGAYVVDGFPAVMQSFDYFTDEDVQNMIAFLKTLE